MKHAVSVVLLLFIVPSIVMGQSATDAGSIRKIRRGTAAAHVDLLRSSAASEFERRVAAFNGETGPARPKTHGGHPVLLGAAIGGGAGYLINATACRTGESVCSGPGNLLMAGIGAGIGAFVGVLVSRR